MSKRMKIMEKMKLNIKSNFGLFITIVICIAFLGSCLSQKTKPAFASPKGLETRVYQVLGMDCPGCHGGVEKLINKIPGVFDSKANWKKKQIVVRIQKEGEVSDESIFEAIRRANFTPGKRKN
ncbi:MAG: heavy metal-associated domain-containing protein [Candidatus Aminicenantaceae bacterium]